MKTIVDLRLSKPVLLLVVMVFLLAISSCLLQKRQALRKGFQYADFKASILVNDRRADSDATNLFDDVLFVPGKDSLRPLLQRMDSLWSNERKERKKEEPATRAEVKDNREAEDAFDHNIKSLRAFLRDSNSKTSGPCRMKECVVMAEVIKTKQVLYLYIGGTLQDSFKVSTGIRSRETPDMNLRPSGPLFMKYTSKKFPGGNYNGLGNMPYAVFLKSGYAIHGTTRGNFTRLGTKASHGCIRLHPDDAKVFFELVKMVGLQNTWVVVR